MIHHFLHLHGHSGYVAVNKKARLLFDNHVGDARMSSGNHREPGSAGLKNRDRSPLAIPVRCLDGVLDEGPRAAHLLLDHLVRPGPEECHGIPQTKAFSHIAARLESGPSPIIRNRASRCERYTSANASNVRKKAPSFQKVALRRERLADL